MYLKISTHKPANSYPKSVKSFVSYLEKENKGKALEDKELFFNQYQDDIVPITVIQEIDANTSKLPKKAPKYYSLMVSPSKYELEHINNNASALKAYIRAIMMDYARNFNREINGKPVSVDDIKYFAKIEHNRFFNSRDYRIKENKPFIRRMTALEERIKHVQSGQATGSVQSMHKELEYLREQTPHKIDGKIIVPGMKKEGFQTHVHVVLSRKDASNSYSLSPGSPYRSSDIVMFGKLVKRGFDRDRFIQKAEKTFDRIFGYKRNYVESYQAMKTLSKDPLKYYTQLNSLPFEEKNEALSMLENKRTNMLLDLNISPNQIKLALSQIRKAIELGDRSSSIGY